MLFLPRFKFFKISFHNLLRHRVGKTESYQFQLSMLTPMRKIATCFVNRRMTVEEHIHEQFAFDLFLADFFVSKNQRCDTFMTFANKTGQFLGNFSLILPRRSAAAPNLAHGQFRLHSWLFQSTSGFSQLHHSFPYSIPSFKNSSATRHSSSYHSLPKRRTSGASRNL